MKIDHPRFADLPRLRQLWQAVFGDSDAFLDLFFSTAFSPDHCMCIQSEQQIVAAAYWMDCSFSGQTAAYVYAVVTAPEHRGQGHCRKLMDAIHRQLSEDGYCGSLLVPAEDSLRQMYAAMGYVDFGGIEEASYTAGDTACQMRSLDPQEFSTLRRRYLPQGGVAQEGKSLSLLAELADFYAGETHLLTVSREGNRILEFLGDPEAIPQSLAALGIPQAAVRLPGNQPFAMYHPLKQIPPPTYFAFAFD